MSRIKTARADMAFFIHRSRVQALYRGLLRLASSPDERMMIRSSFRAPGGSVKDGEGLTCHDGKARARAHAR